MVTIKAIQYYRERLFCQAVRVDVRLQVWKAEWNRFYFILKGRTRKTCYGVARRPKGSTL